MAAGVSGSSAACEFIIADLRTKREVRAGVALLHAARIFCSRESRGGDAAWGGATLDLTLLEEPEQLLDLARTISAGEFLHERPAATSFTGSRQVFAAPRVTLRAQCVRWLSQLEVLHLSLIHI